MATNPSPLLDFEPLLAPIPGPEPAGSSLPYILRERLDLCRREINPSDYDPSDPQRPTTAKSADWSAIVQLSQQVLRETSKDLSVAARLTEALVKHDRFAGLRDGLRLLRLMVEQCWDRLSPALEEGDDLEVRAAAFRWLDDPDRGASFPSTLRAVPLVRGEGAEYGWLDWRRSQDPRSGLTPELFDKARQLTPVDSSRDAVELLAAARLEFDGLVHALDERMGESAPALLGLRQAFDDCQLLANQILQLNAAPDLPLPEPNASSDPADPADSIPSSGTTASATGRQPLTRTQIYAQLTDAANALRRLEPHSPIPYLLERAVNLGALPFPLLMKELIRDTNVLTEMSREMGFKEGSPE
ncbi:type VI secretion system protein ImpA [Singulisphaera sp. GP187]|uniref:type VI secretion system protein TssA n=1 Tax=Singulisphaera sp. GP187 TaxID=1882752 RepID=UPI000927CB8C|nr:type VI secretion system protein TssA [Singulisphaera sp. GP187]SIO60627.1 type VI secretion system protein ImpA [Singulisphaera sp. GP187]